MKVTYDTTNTGGSLVVLSDLGEFEISGESSQREPAESPLRERHTLRLRLKFFAATYAANAALVAQARAAVTRQQGRLTVETPGGVKLVDREVFVGETDEPEEDRAPLAGTSRQGITLAFYWWVHLTNAEAGALAGTYQRTGGGAPVSLGCVERWSERLAAERFDPLKSARRRVTGTVAAGGWFTVDTTLALAARQAALTAAAAALREEVLAAPDGALSLGNAFARTVRVGEFNAEVNQPLCRVEWSLTATWTAYPDEGAMALLEYTVAAREHYRDGSADLVLSGRAQAATLAAASTRLAALKAAVPPADYALIEEEVTPAYGVSESGGAGDGETWLHLNFTLEWRRIGATKPAWQRAGGPRVELGAMERWSERYSAQFADDLRAPRRRAQGTVELAGWLTGGTGATTPAALQALKDTLMRELTIGGTGTLTCGEFSQAVRVADFRVELNQPKHRVEWSLAATWTRFPNEADYALVEYAVEDSTDQSTGVSGKRLTGRIGAPTALAARLRLEQLRTQTLDGNQYTRREEQSAERRVECDTDGAAFIELSFAETWVRVEGAIVHYTVRVAEADDLASGWVRQSWSGTVTARGATQAVAYAAAAARAAELGDNRAPLRLSAQVRRTEPQLQRALAADGAVIQDAALPDALVTVEFEYEYRVKGTRVYVEYQGVTQQEAFGRSVDTVSGSVAGPDLPAALAAYAAIKQTLGGLVLSEQTTHSRVRGGGQEFFDRLQFTCALHLAKTAVTASYAVTTEADWVALARNTTVRGQVWGPDQATCAAYLDGTLLPGLGGLGARITSQRTSAAQSGHQPGGQPRAGVFTGLEFTETYTLALTGVEGVIECAVTEDVTHSGTRWVEKALPDGPSLFQSVGVVPAQRVVSGTVRALTRQTCSEWAARCRLLLLVGPNGHEHPPQMQWQHSFARMVSGYPVADGAIPANVQCHTLSFTFRESLPEKPWSG